MDPVHMTTSEAITFVALVNAAIGLVLGLIPLLFGYFNKRLKLGVAGFLSALLGGAVLGIFLSVPAAIVFTWLVVRKQKPSASPAESETYGDRTAPFTDSDRDRP